MKPAGAIAAILAAAFLVAACGGDDDPETVTVTETQTQTAPATEPERTTTEPDTTTTEPEKPRSADCGDIAQSGAGTYNVRATGVDCETAIVIARQWEDECATRPDGSCRVTLGFSCRYRQAGYESGVINCTSGARAVTFETGA